jgi:hypothetical protein
MEMRMDSLLMVERINEVEKMCDRNNPIYEQISCFSIALYVIGCFDSQDLISVDDLDDFDAADFLKENFEEIAKTDMARGYNMADCDERYLVVLGDPELPKHFAVVADLESKRPFFSKLKFLGAGYDNLEELLTEYKDEGVTGYEDVHYFKLKENRRSQALDGQEETWTEPVPLYAANM